MSAPTRDREAVLELYRRHLSRGRAALIEVSGGPVELRSEGSRVVGQDGESFLDCGGFAVFTLGHCHPRVVEAVVRQAATHPLGSSYFLDPVRAEAAAALAEVAPPGLVKVHWANSGTEATEAAIKLARAHGKRTLVSMRAGFHGKTMGALSATRNPAYQDPFRPLLPAVEVEYGDAGDLERALRRHSGCCVIVEPVQGEGGVVVPPDGYLAAVRTLCREYDAFLVADEVQTGMGRLGTWWGVDRDGVTPDAMLVGKALSGGVVPVAAMLATEEAYAPFDHDPTLHTSTFAGAPIATAAAHAAIATLRQERLVERARELGERLLEEISAVVEESCPDLVKEVRGRGLLIGIEFVSPALVAEIGFELLERGVIVNHSLNAQSVLRLTPSAVMTDGEVGELCRAMGAAAEVVASEASQVPA